MPRGMDEFWLFNPKAYEAAVERIEQELLRPMEDR
jgi:hypothetical protein